MMKSHGDIPDRIPLSYLDSKLQYHPTQNQPAPFGAHCPINAETGCGCHSLTELSQIESTKIQQLRARTKGTSSNLKPHGR